MMRDLSAQAGKSKLDEYRALLLKLKQNRITLVSNLHVSSFVNGMIAMPIMNVLSKKYGLA